MGVDPMPNIRTEWDDSFRSCAAHAVDHAGQKVGSLVFHSADPVHDVMARLRIEARAADALQQLLRGGGGV